MDSSEVTYNSSQVQPAVYIHLSCDFQDMEVGHSAAELYACESTEVLIPLGVSLSGFFNEHCIGFQLSKDLFSSNRDRKRSPQSVIAQLTEALGPSRESAI